MHCDICGARAGATRQYAEGKEVQFTSTESSDDDMCRYAKACHFIAASQNFTVRVVEVHQLTSLLFENPVFQKAFLESVRRSMFQFPHHNFHFVVHYEEAHNYAVPSSFAEFLFRLNGKLRQC